MSSVIFCNDSSYQKLWDSKEKHDRFMNGHLAQAAFMNLMHNTQAVVAWHGIPDGFWDYGLDVDQVVSLGIRKISGTIKTLKGKKVDILEETK